MLVKKEATKRKKGSLPHYTIKIETKIIFVCYLLIVLNLNAQLISLYFSLSVDCAKRTA